MKMPQEPLDPIERMLLDHAAAGRAGVFRHTGVSPDTLMTARSLRSRLARFTLTGLSAAACIFLAVGIGRVLLNTEVGSPTAPGSDVGAAIPVALEWNQFSHCLSGPGRTLATGCGRADLDADGDVDLADVSRFQVAYRDRARDRIAPRALPPN